MPLREGQKAAAKEWSLIATCISVLIVGSATAGYLLLQILRAWGWIG